MSSGYEHNYEEIVHKLKGCDFSEAAARLGLNPPVNGKIKISFLGRDYEMSQAGVVPANGLSSDPNARSILIYYITSRGFGEPEYSYRLLHHFVPAALGAANVSWLTAPLIRKFGNDFDKFYEVMKNLGAVYEKSAQEREHIWNYRILPKVPVQIIYFEGDEEFPAQVRVLLDSSAGRFMEFEQLAFLCGCLVRTLVNLGENLEKNKHRAPESPLG